MKIRADELLVSRGLATSRTRAQSLILSGVVYSGGRQINKSGQLLSPSSEIIIKGKDHPFVSRGGVKLKAALDHFKILVKGKIGLDVGASTGGFTDCLLKEGAKKVYALDVGYGQLDNSLRKDPRVVVMERINFRYFDIHQIPEPVDLVVIDVSFISLTRIIPKVLEIFSKIPPAPFAKGGGTPLVPPLKKGGEGGFLFLIALIKPQFEAGPKFVKKGIVRDLKKQEECVTKISDFCRQQGLEILGTLPSPIRGRQGNQEYLLAARLQAV